MDTLVRQPEQELAACEQRLARLYVEERHLRRKYRRDLDGLSELLEAMEDEGNFEELTVENVPVLEAVSDTRRWEHILEDIDQEEKRLDYLKALARISGVTSEWRTL